MDKICRIGSWLMLYILYKHTQFFLNDVVYRMGSIIFVLIVKHLCIVCAIECVMATCINPNLLTIIIYGC